MRGRRRRVWEAEAEGEQGEEGGSEVLREEKDEDDEDSKDTDSKEERKIAGVGWGGIEGWLSNHLIRFIFFSRGVSIVEDEMDYARIYDVINSKDFGIQFNV